jgi:hypothetical protein
MMQRSVAKVFDRKQPDWRALLAELRALGGTAENVTLRHGTRGRGLFPLNPADPVRLLLPPNLLVNAEDTEIRDHRLVVKTSAAIGEQERTFFDRYQEDFSWGAGVFDDLWQTQLAYSQLPEDVRGALPVNGSFFFEPSEDRCHKLYVKTRQIIYDNAHVLMPLVELVNHDSAFSGYETQNGLAIGGMFDREVLVNYGRNDCWGMATTYSFWDTQNAAYSLTGNFKFGDSHIEISRKTWLSKRVNGYPMPIVRVVESTIRFPFLMLGDVQNPHLPRSIFLHIVKDTPIKEPDVLFDLIHHYNRLLFLKFLQASDGNATPLVAMLRSAAYQQLSTLSSH